MSEEVENTLRARIAALEAEVEQLQSGGENPKPRDRSQPIERLVVQDDGQLYLNDRDLALQIIDALPVQIFVKRAHPELDAAGLRGRRYTFMNRKALELTGWEAGTEIEHLDRDAMVDPVEYERMDQVESNTIKDNKIHFEELRWTAPDGSWRINDVTQLPIARRSGDGEDQEVIGFCALAQDIVFAQRSEVLGPLMDIMAHEIGNLAGVVLSLTKDAADGSADVTGSLNEALGWCRAASDIADAMLASYSDEAPEYLSTAGDILQHITQIFEHVPIEFVTSLPDEAALAQLKTPVAVRGVLVELVRNAFKHTSKEFRTNNRRTVRISASLGQLKYDVAGRKVVRNSVVWRITNRCSNATAGIEFGEKLTPLRTGGMGGRVILGLIAHSIFVDTNEPPASALGRYIRFEDRSQTDGEVDVYFYAPTETASNGDS